jgi:UDP-glucose 4-epimerase
LSVLIVGGAGFVGLNIVELLLRRGISVVVLDRADMPEVARAELAAHPGRLTCMQGDIEDRDVVDRAIARGIDAIVLGAAITANAARDAEEPERILRVNLLSQVPILAAAKAASVRRVVNLSSGSAYGAIADGAEELDEAMRPDPVSLYALSKFASEKLGARLADLWKLDLVSVRLSTVFGPWERPTGVRDTLSPQVQIMAAAHRGERALLARPAPRDWIYAPDVAAAVVTLIDAPRPVHTLYNISTGRVWPLLAWGEQIASQRPGFACRLAREGERATIDLHTPSDRAPLAVARMRDEFGWSAAWGMEDSARHLDAWWRSHPHYVGAVS